MKFIDIVSFGTVSLSYEERNVCYYELEQSKAIQKLGAVLSEVYEY